MFPSFKLLGTTLYSYPLLLGAIWALAFQYIKILNRDLKKINLLFICVFVASWLGAKATFLLTLEGEVSANLAVNHAFWMGGGFVFYGGLIGGSIVLLAHKVLFGTPASAYDFLVLPLALGHAFGRIACFLAGCCYGKASDLPWAVFMHNDHRHPVQLYESLALILIYFYLRSRWSRGQKLFFHYLISYAIVRFGLEFFRGDEVRGLYFDSISTSQVVSLAIILSLLVYTAAGKFRSS